MKAGTKPSPEAASAIKRSGIRSTVRTIESRRLSTHSTSSIQWKNSYFWTTCDDDERRAPPFVIATRAISNTPTAPYLNYYEMLLFGKYFCIELDELF
jgi:hypothetical protein